MLKIMKKSILFAFITAWVALCSTASFTAKAQLVSFTTNTNNGCPPLTVNCTNTSIMDTTGVTFYWYFNDPPNSVPSDSAYNFSYTYLAPGNYNLRLRAYDSLSSYVGEYQQIINVQGSTGAFFPADSSSFCPNEMISFYTYDQWNSLNWNFGDSTPDANWNWATHAYTDSGIYTVRLIHNHVCGTDTVFQTLFINNGVVPVPQINSNANVA